jgi:hypothetical protein
MRAPGLGGAAGGAVIVLAAAALAAGCSTPRPVDPLQLDGNLLTVTNQSGTDWSHVEIWLNTYYRVTTDLIGTRGRLQVPLDTFVAGFGQRFDFRRAQVKDLRLTARTPDGKPVELKMEFRPSGLDILKKKPS